MPDMGPDDITRSFIHLERNSLIGHYRIIERIGAGGMGEIYLAEDTSLNRKVALKFLPSHLCRDAEFRARFSREAQAAARLSHPNIVTIFEVSEVNGQLFLAMEYVEGQSLRDQTKGKQLPLEQVLNIAIQLCAGLQAAHEKGIVHRDIKPANTLIDTSGRVRIVDFGLAAVRGGEPLTRTGSTLGTIGYMSPEQVEGEPTDERSDIFSCGVVIYEMITGQSPFAGPSDVATLHNIVYQELKPLSHHRKDIPENLEATVSKALAKDRGRRYQHIEELLADLLTLQKTLDASSIRRISHPSCRSRKMRLPTWLWVAVFAIVISGSFLLLSSMLGHKRETIHRGPLHQQVTYSGDVDSPVISPDGKTIAYLSVTSEGKQALYVKDIAGGKAVQVYEGRLIERIRWSPDGSSLAFYTKEDTLPNYSLFIIPRLGGTSRRLRIPGYFSWSPDGESIATCSPVSRRLIFIDIATGDTSSVPILGDYTWIRDADWSPEGNFLLCLTLLEDRHQYTLWAVRRDGKGQRKIFQDSIEILSPRWGANGQTIYFLKSQGQTQDLWKVKVDQTTAVPGARPSRIQTGLPAGGEFSIAVDINTLIYTRVQSFSNLWLAQYSSTPTDGYVMTKQLSSGTSRILTPSISPEGRRIAFCIGNEVECNLFVMPIDGGEMEQLTFSHSRNIGPAWSPDGTQLAFNSKEGGSQRVWTIPVNGGVARSFTKSNPSDAETAIAWSPGSDILYMYTGNRNIHILNPVTQVERPLFNPDPPGWCFSPSYSPGGDSVLLEFSGKDACIMLKSLLGPQQTVFSPVTGRFAVLGWSPDGQWIYFCGLAKLRLNTLVYVSPIWRYSLRSNQKEPFIDLPFKNVDYVDMDSERNTIVCSVLETHSDAWLMTNFDPEIP